MTDVTRLCDAALVRRAADLEGLRGDVAEMERAAAERICRAERIETSARKLAAFLDAALSDVAGELNRRAENRAAGSIASEPGCSPVPDDERHVGSTRHAGDGRQPNAGHQREAGAVRSGDTTGPDTDGDRP